MAISTIRRGLKRNGCMYCQDSAHKIRDLAPSRQQGSRPVLARCVTWVGDEMAWLQRVTVYLNPTGRASLPTRPEGTRWMALYADGVSVWMENKTEAVKKKILQKVQGGCRDLQGKNRDLSQKDFSQKRILGSLVGRSSKVETATGAKPRQGLCDLGKCCNLCGWGNARLQFSFHQMAWTFAHKELMPFGATPLGEKSSFQSNRQGL